jgi:hypothetical protein
MNSLSKDPKKIAMVVLTLVVVWCFNIYFKKRHEKDFLVAGTLKISVKPCLEVMDDFFGKGVNAPNICSCLLQRHYEQIKNNPSQLNLLKDEGFGAIVTGKNDSTKLLFRDCVIENITDTVYKMHFTEAIKLQLKARLIAEMTNRFDDKLDNLDSVCNCVVEALNNNLTIKEYFQDDYLKPNQSDTLVKSCIKKLKYK